jgi:hypothetical protein
VAVILYMNTLGKYLEEKFTIFFTLDKYQEKKTTTNLLDAQVKLLSIYGGESYLEILTSPIHAAKEKPLPKVSMLSVKKYKKFNTIKPHSLILHHHI